MRYYPHHRVLLRLTLAFLTLSALACAHSRTAPSSAVEERVIVYGVVTKSDSTPAAGAVIRSAASLEEECDAHEHTGRGVPEEVRAGANGWYRQLVVAQGRPGCIRVTASSADGASKGYSTMVAPRMGPTAAATPDSIRLDIRLR